MSEYLYEPTPTQLFGLSLRDWHLLLTTDLKTGEDTGHLATPGSRYGRDADRCAWYAIATALAFESAGGVIERLEEADDALEYFMSLCVNDNPAPAELIAGEWDNLPEDITQFLGDRDNINSLVN